MAPSLPPVAQIARYRHIPVRPADLRRLHRMVRYCLLMGLLNVVLSLCIVWR